MKATVPRLSSVVVSARQAAARLLNTSAPIFAPAVLGKIDFHPEGIEVRGEDLVFPVKATKHVTNAFRSMHGGALASLADMFTTLHLWGHDLDSRHVSVSFDIQFLAAAVVDGDFECVTRVTKRGKRLAFTEFSFLNKATGEVVCRGTHTKAFI